MRLPLPPSATLSPSGKHAAAAYGSLLAHIDTQAAERTDLHLPGPLQAAAFANDDSSMLVATSGALHSLPLDALSRGSAAWSDHAGVPLPGSAFRIAAGAGHACVIVRTSERTMGLCGVRMSPGEVAHIGEPEGRDLGAVAVHHLRVNDDAGGQPIVLLGGVRGRQARSGEGEAFTGLMGLAPDYPLLWKGAGLPFTPHACLYPLADGTLGVTNRHTLARLDVSDPSNVILVGEQPWPTPLETVALSPDGTRLAWMWAGEGSTMHLQAGRSNDPKPEMEITFELGGLFPSLAVDNDGVVTVVWGSRPDWLHVLRAAPEAGAEETRLHVPAESD